MTYIEEQNEEEQDAQVSLPELLNNLMSRVSYDLRVAIPAKVIKYDFEKQSVNCQPCFKNRYADGTAPEPAIVYNVPVAFPRAGGSFISLPIKEGHFVLLVMADRSLEKWLSSGKVVDPEDDRAHHLSDAIAIPGCYPFTEPASVNNPNDIIVCNKNTDGQNFLEMRLKPNNHLQILNKTDELVKVLSDLVQTLREAVVYTSTGAQKLRHHKFAEVHNRLKTFLER